MNEERIAYFTNKITNSNKSELICVLYEIYFEYIEIAKDSKELDKTGLRMASQTLEHLKNALNFQYEISGNLFSLYDYCQRQISQAMYKNSTEPLDVADKVMKGLYSSFLEVAKQDDSEPLMSNTQQINAGFTYGKTGLNENAGDSNRGFLA